MHFHVHIEVQPTACPGAVQAFTVVQPVWLKYLQFHFISQYGTEPMCALNDILVYGKSAAEDLEDQLSATSLPEDDVQADIKPESVTEQSEVQQQTRPNAAGPLIVSQDTGADSQTDGQSDAAMADSSTEGIVDVSNASGSASAHAGMHLLLDLRPHWLSSCHVCIDIARQCCRELECSCSSLYTCCDVLLISGIHTCCRDTGLQCCIVHTLHVLG